MVVPYTDAFFRRFFTFKPDKQALISIRQTDWLMYNAALFGRQPSFRKDICACRFMSIAVTLASMSWRRCKK
jgi:hypothetical protein